MTKLLDEAAIRSYRDAGFHTPLRVLSGAEALAIRSALEAVEAEQGPVFTENRAHAGAAFQGSYRYKSHLLFKWLADVVRHPVILDAVEDLIGPDILCWTTHWFVKEAHSPQYVSWHQDSNYWGVETDDLVSVWLAVSASTVESGCVRLLPGSHGTPPMEHVDTWAENNMLTRGQTIEGAQRIAGRQSGARAGRGGAVRLSARPRLAPEPQRRPPHRHRPALHPAHRTPGQARMGFGHAGARHGYMRPFRAGAHSDAGLRSGCARYVSQERCGATRGVLPGRGGRGDGGVAHVSPRSAAGPTRPGLRPAVHAVPFLGARASCPLEQPRASGESSIAGLRPGRAGCPRSRQGVARTRLNRRDDGTPGTHPVRAGCRTSLDPAIRRSRWPG